MARLTITLSDERHRALKLAAARRGITLGQLIEASLDSWGIKTTEAASEIVARARAANELSEHEALELAVKETRTARAR